MHGSIIEVECERDGPDAFGRIKSGHLEIEAELLPCKLRRYCAVIFDGVLPKQQTEDLMILIYIAQRGQMSFAAKHQMSDWMFMRRA